MVSPHAPSPRNSSGKFRRARGVRDGCSSQSRVGSGAQRQAQRPGPRFRDLKSAFDAKRVELGRELPDETAPSMVVVLDLVDGVTDFQNAVNRIERFEFLSEWVDPRDSPSTFQWSECQLTGKFLCDSEYFFSDRAEEDRGADAFFGYARDCL